METQTYQPLVSVILSTYNGSKYLREQLNSVINQSYKNLEIIAVDDDSKDDTISILHEYRAMDNRIKVFVNDKNLGYIKSFEKAMLLASGEFLALCDQDDVWYKDKISLLLANIENYPLIYCDSELTDENLQSLHKNLSDTKNLKTYRNCLVFATDNFLAGHAALITKKLFEISYPFPEWLPHDYWLAFVATLHGGVKYYNAPLVKYRHHHSNVIGAINVYGNKPSPAEKRRKKEEDQKKIRMRIEKFYEICDENLSVEKKVLYKLKECYRDFSFHNNIKRVKIFFKNRDTLLAIKKRSEIRKWMFCFKMFTRIR